MVRIVLGVIVGFIVWSIVWIGGQSLLMAVSPDWIGSHMTRAGEALTNGGSFQGDATIDILNLVRSFLTSIIAGYMTALVAGEYRKSTLALGMLLVLFGIGVQALAWNLAPIWYHVIFILALVPMTILGGKLRRSS